MTQQTNIKTQNPTEWSYYHIPKTGGVSMVEFCGETGILHLGHVNFKAKQPALLKDYTKEGPVFSMIRNPVDRWLSAYKFLKYGGVTIEQDQAEQAILKKSEVNEYIEHGAWQNLLHFRKQTEMISDDQGNLLTDQLFYYPDFKGVAEFFGIRNTIPHKNRSTGTDTIDLETKMLLLDHYQEDIQLIYKTQTWHTKHKNNS